MVAINVCDWKYLMWYTVINWYRDREGDRVAALSLLSTGFIGLICNYPIRPQNKNRVNITGLVNHTNIHWVIIIWFYDRSRSHQKPWPTYKIDQLHVFPTPPFRIENVKLCLSPSVCVNQAVRGEGKIQNEKCKHECMKGTYREHHNCFVCALV